MTPSAHTPSQGRLGDIITLQRGFDLPESQRKDGDVPVIASTGIVGFHSEKRVDAPGVVIGRSGSIGGGQYIADDFWPLNTTLWVRDFKGHHPRFVFYLLRNIDFTPFNAGVGVPTLNRNHLDSLAVPLFGADSERRIADILSAYEDLLENNLRCMALLEEAAQQLYREWFVRLRFPGHEHTRITNGVPEGWERRTFGEACSSLEDGDWIETRDQGGDDYRLLQISNIGINEFVETGNFRYITEQTFKQLNCRELLPGHILIARMPKPIGRAWLVTKMPWRMVTAVDAAIATANEALADAYFLTYHLNSPPSLDHCERRAGGATRPRVARRELAALPLLIPPRRLQEHFREFAEPLNQQRAIIYRQNEKLRAARDLLLPRLMSGHIAV